MPVVNTIYIFWFSINDEQVRKICLRLIPYHGNHELFSAHCNRLLCKQSRMDTFICP